MILVFSFALFPILRFRVYIWTFWEWSLLFYWGSNKGHWHWAPVGFLRRHQQRWEVWAPYQPHRSVWATDKILVRTAHFVSQLNTDTCFSFSGLFKVVPEDMPYTSVEEMVSLRPLDLESSLPFTFTNRSKITVGNFTLGAGRALTVLSIERREGEVDHVRCHVKGQQETSAEVCIPFSAQGEFKECESEERFTLREIMSSPCLCSRKFRFINTTKCDRPLVLCPIYQVHAIMSSKNTLIFSFKSDLHLGYIMVIIFTLFICWLKLNQINVNDMWMYSSTALYYD